MKKTLVALAALAVVGVASAQSSVTLYGVGDISLFSSDAPGVTTQMSSSGAMNNGNSRFGFRGTEDLGGGLKASFNMEAGFSSETGAANTSGGNLFSRAANLSVSGGFGTLLMGRTLTPSFFGLAAWELTGTANYSAVANQFGGGAIPGVFRNSSQFSYTTPNMSGFTGTLGYVFEADNGGNAKTDANLIYNAGPLAVGFSYNKVANAESGYALGASYNFGVATVAASLQDPSGKGKGWTLGVTVPVGAASVTMDFARDTDFDDTDVVLEAKYPLSKRTFVYGAYLRDGSGKTATDVNSYGIGIRHNF